MNDLEKALTRVNPELESRRVPEDVLLFQENPFEGEELGGLRTDEIPSWKKVTSREFDPREIFTTWPVEVQVIPVRAGVV
jgi:hypothetical protein